MSANTLAIIVLLSSAGVTAASIIRMVRDAERSGSGEPNEAGAAPGA